MVKIEKVTSEITLFTKGKKRFVTNKKTKSIEVKKYKDSGKGFAGLWNRDFNFKPKTFKTFSEAKSFILSKL